MRAKHYVVDTNVIVSGLIGADPNSPPARIVDAMLDGVFVYAISPDLLEEYASVLARPKISRLHRLGDEELDRVLADLVANAVWREPTASEPAPDPHDDHLWALLGALPRGCLITGDGVLVADPPTDASVVSPRRFVETMLELGWRDKS